MLRGGTEEEAVKATPQGSPFLQFFGSRKAILPLSDCWALLDTLMAFVKSSLSPSYKYLKVDTAILGAESQSGWEEEDESWRTARKKIHKMCLSPATRKRVLRDLRTLKLQKGIGIEVEDAECLTDWVIKVRGAEGTVFAGEVYRLRVRFHADYPYQPPEVTFMRPAPLHEHVYSDGKICLNILYSDWNPAMDVKSICLSLLSMLSSATRKSRPPDNDSTVVMSRGQKTRNMQWEFHDDNC